MEIGTQKIDILMQSYLTDDDLKALFNLLCDDILNSGLKELPKFYDVKGDTDSKRNHLKQLSAAMTTLLLESAKQDVDSNTLRSYGHLRQMKSMQKTVQLTTFCVKSKEKSLLEDHNVSNSKIETFIAVFESRKLEIKKLLTRNGHSLDTIVDVNWKLDYCVKSNLLDCVKEPIFTVTLKTKKLGCNDLQQTQFTCTQEQLQDLVAKLKDACRNVERASQM